MKSFLPYGQLILLSLFHTPVPHLPNRLKHLDRYNPVKLAFPAFGETDVSDDDSIEETRQIQSARKSGSQHTKKSRTSTHFR